MAARRPVPTGLRSPRGERSPPVCRGIAEGAAPVAARLVAAVEVVALEATVAQTGHGRRVAGGPPRPVRAGPVDVPVDAVVVVAPVGPLAPGAHLQVRRPRRRWGRRRGCPGRPGRPRGRRRPPRGCRRPPWGRRRCPRVRLVRLVARPGQGRLRVVLPRRLGVGDVARRRRERGCLADVGEVGGCDVGEDGRVVGECHADVAGGLEVEDDVGAPSGPVAGDEVEVDVLGASRGVHVGVAAVETPGKVGRLGVGGRDPCWADVCRVSWNSSGGCFPLLPALLGFLLASFSPGWS